MEVRRLRGDVEGGGGTGLTAGTNESVRLNSFTYFSLFACEDFGEEHNYSGFLTGLSFHKRGCLVLRQR